MRVFLLSSKNAHSVWEVPNAYNGMAVIPVRRALHKEGIGDSKTAYEKPQLLWELKGTSCLGMERTECAGIE
jgi:hypothetical protein